MKSLSLCIITRGEDNLRECVLSAAPAVDEVILVCDSHDKDKVERVADELSSTLPVVVKIFDWHDDFAAVRNFAFEQASNDWVFWLDSDDILTGAESLRQWFEAQPDTPTWYACARYNYEFTPEGRCIRSQFRERVMPRKAGEWIGSIHEVWLPTNIESCQPTALPQDVVVDHQLILGDAEAIEKRHRNLAMLQKNIEDADGEPDQRLVMHYGLALLGAGKFEECRRVFGEFIRREPRGWGRVRALLMIANSYQAERNWLQAEYALMLALAECPSALEPCVRMFTVSIMQERWKEALHWFDQAFGRQAEKREVDMIMWDPSVEEPDYRAAGMAAIEAGDTDLALKYAEEAGDSDAAKLITDTVQDGRLVDAIMELCRNMKTDEERRELCMKVPHRLQDFPQIQAMMLPELPEDKVTVAIHCGREGWGGGQSATWGPDSLVEGIGGSEEMVIRIAPELVANGCHVEVYGPWPKTEVRDGVHWIRWEAFSAARAFDVFVAWRYPSLTEFAPLAKKRVVWCHDALQAPQFHGFEASVDEVWALSEYHKEVLEEAAPWAKIWVTRNGIPDLSEYLASPFDQKRAIYSSSPDRGLDNLLNWWPDIREQVPDATLHIFYGFNSWWKRAELTDPNKREFRARIEKQVEELDGVVWHGNVGQDQLHKEMAASGVWLYPTEFNEISCITAMKAQALCLIPVCPPYAALGETVRTQPLIGDDESSRTPNIKEFREEFIQDAVKALEGVHDFPNLAEVQDYFNITTLAAEWADHLKEIKVDAESQRAAREAV